MTIDIQWENGDIEEYRLHIVTTTKNCGQEGSINSHSATIVIQHKGNELHIDPAGLMAEL